MKKFAVFLLFCLGIAGDAIFRADTSHPEEVTYQATIAKGMEGVLEVMQ